MVNLTTTTRTRITRTTPLTNRAPATALLQQARLLDVSMASLVSLQTLDSGLWPLASALLAGALVSLPQLRLPVTSCTGLAGRPSSPQDVCRCSQQQKRESSDRQRSDMHAVPGTIAHLLPAILPLALPNAGAHVHIHIRHPRNAMGKGGFRAEPLRSHTPPVLID